MDKLSRLTIVVRQHCWDVIVKRKGRLANSSYSLSLKSSFSDACKDVASLLYDFSSAVMKTLLVSGLKPTYGAMVCE